MIPYIEYTLEVMGTNILNQSGSKSQLKFKLIETNGIKPQPKLQIMALPIFTIGSEAVFETILYPICGEPIEEYHNNLQVSNILFIYLLVNLIISITGICYLNIIIIIIIIWTIINKLHND